MPDNGASALLHGASASITGNMLTTSSNDIQDDMKLLSELGLTNKLLPTVNESYIGAASR